MTRYDEHAGWYYEAGDPSGLFGGGWVHDACPAASMIDEAREAVEEVVNEVRKDRETVVVTMRITCGDCGQSFVYDYNEWDPLDDNELENPMVVNDDLLPKTSVLDFGVRRRHRIRDLADRIFIALCGGGGQGLR